MSYDELPTEVRSRLSADQWQRQRERAISPGESVPASGRYLDLQSGQERHLEEGDPAPGPILPMQDLARTGSPGGGQTAGATGGEGGTRTRTAPSTDPRSHTWGE